MRISLLLLMISVITAHGQGLKTIFEKSGGKQTATYQQAIDYYQELAGSSNDISIQTMGATDSGKPLHLVTLDLDRSFDFEKSHQKGKTVILINNGIHPGEPDGIEASMMLLRDFANDQKKRVLIKDIVLAVIPIYNIGGALNRNSTSRANQVGPEAYGFRGNARNFDLNRDFIKTDTRNARSFQAIFQLVNPDIFIDTHVSNGADYQYSITHLATQPNKMGGALGNYIENDFILKLEEVIKNKGSEITPYVNVFNSTPDEKGFSQFMDSPRYSTGYTTLFNSLGFMIETHMLKPFDIRVKATYDFLETVLEIAKTDGSKIKQLRQARLADVVPGNKYPISWKLDRSRHRKLNFKGYEGKMMASKVTGKQRLFYDRTKPFSKTIPYYNSFEPSQEIIIPEAYIIPQGWHNIIDRLKSNNVQYKRLQSDTLIEVQSYRIGDFKTAESPFEGHYLHFQVELGVSKKFIQFSAGDYLIPVNQFAARYLIETLEPQAKDSFFAWNFFDTILQRKEGFSPYVFEDEAWELLNNDKLLKKDFEYKKNTDTTFADSWYAQLDFIYKRSALYEEAHMEYPIYRVMK